MTMEPRSTIYDAFGPVIHIPEVQQLLDNFKRCSDSCANLPVSMAAAILFKEYSGGDEMVRKAALKIISYQERIQDPCHLWTVLNCLLIGHEDEIDV